MALALGDLEVVEAGGLGGGDSEGRVFHYQGVADSQQAGSQDVGIGGGFVAFHIPPGHHGRETGEDSACFEQRFHLRPERGADHRLRQAVETAQQVHHFVRNGGVAGDGLAVKLLLVRVLREQLGRIGRRVAARGQDFHHVAIGHADAVALPELPVQIDVEGGQGLLPTLVM